MLATAHAFLGMVLIRAFSQGTLTDEQAGSMDRQDWIEEIVDVFIHGIGQGGM